MTEHDFLYDLVQSLDEGELRFIRNFASARRKKPEKLLALLKDVRNAKTFSPKLLKEKYSSYGVAKFKLKQLILHSLRLMNTEENAEQRINVHLENEGILYRRGIHYQAMKELNNARKIAEKYEKLDRLLQILQLHQRRLIEYKTKNLVEEVQENMDSIKAVLARMNREIEVTLHYQQLFAQYRTQDHQALDGTEAPVLPDDLPDVVEESFQTQVVRTSVEGLVARSKGDYEGAARATKKALELYEQEAYAHFLEDQHVRYKLFLANYGIYLVPTGQFDELKRIVDLFREMKDPDFNGEAETFQNRVHLELLWRTNVVELDGLEALEKEIEAGMDKYQGKINAARQLSIWYNLVVAHFLNEDFEAVWRQLERILEHKRFRVRREIQYTVRMLELIVSYELEIWDLPDHAINRVERFLQRNDQVTPFKMTVIRHVDRLVKTPLRERAAVFSQWSEELHALREEGQVTDDLGLTLVTAWADWKTKGGRLKDALGKRP